MVCHVPQARNARLDIAWTASAAPSLPAVVTANASQDLETACATLDSQTPSAVHARRTTMALHVGIAWLPKLALVMGRACHPVDCVRAIRHGKDHLVPKDLWPSVPEAGLSHRTEAVATCTAEMLQRTLKRGRTRSRSVVSQEDTLQPLALQPRMLKYLAFAIPNAAGLEGMIEGQKELGAGTKTIR